MSEEINNEMRGPVDWEGVTGNDFSNPNDEFKQDPVDWEGVEW